VPLHHTRARRREPRRGLLWHLKNLWRESRLMERWGRWREEESTTAAKVGSLLGRPRGDDTSGTRELFFLLLPFLNEDLT
jgi:hypothetical protein